jgi:hypothetical protein
MSEFEICIKMSLETSITNFSCLKQKNRVISKTYTVSSDFTPYVIISISIYLQIKSATLGTISSLTG